ncbi:efflux RND transporter periplasmic adaptor subunit [Sporomusa acidovorans]|uniref:Macrolide export protein MacA n=1 Tax=Sporomusa acidovorans (strain ATCC 49682 / DSM 3132 / Mol) TaxID=1123286 RepID=A0ABZ3IXI2_SPOA4|nr:efflux RND transporter periplasmic adaptor subunit [Sporomusa acidovorans]OZC22381.1 macrolide export protein MacA [Sporomusa acidovorans DSM 3132]SDE47504.1 HlyD family secretion protein [Sporomusa acidovorans]
MKTMWQKIRNHKTLLLTLLIAAAVAAGGGYYYQSKSKTATAPQQTIQAERRDLTSVVAATGTIKAVNSVDISSKITARIKEVKAQENEQVTAGQVLVILEDAGLQAQVTQAKEKLDNAAVKLQRVSRLTSIGGSSKEQLDNASMDYNIAQANYDEVMSKLNDTVIISPIAGHVIGKPLSAGELVAQGVNNPTVIMTIADMSTMQIEANVDQTDIGKIALGQNVTFTVDAYPGKVFSGRVTTISRKATVSQNVTYYPVTIDVLDAENLLNPGMVARVSVIVSESKNALTLPLSAIRSDKSGKYVVVAGPNGQTQNVPVTTGNTGDDRVEIISGLNDGDKVVVSQVKTQSQGQTGSQQGSRQGGGVRPLF